MDKKKSSDGWLDIASPDVGVYDIVLTFLLPLIFYPRSRVTMALAGVKVIELAGLAPAPFCGMILADFGAKVIRVDRTKVAMSLDTQVRGKKSVAINLKTPEGVAVLRKLCVQSDVVLEPYRKGLANNMRKILTF